MRCGDGATLVVDGGYNNQREHSNGGVGPGVGSTVAFAPLLVTQGGALKPD